MRPLVLAFALTLVPAVGLAQSLTVKDMIELSKAGLGEEVLLALIDVHTPVFPADPETLRTLKAAGVPSSVIVAMVRSGRMPLPEPPAPQIIEAPEPAPAPQVVVVEREVEPRVREVAVPVPVYVPVPVRRSHYYYDSPRPAPKPVQPVYWGWGGKLRPDAWTPTHADVQKDPRVPREPQKK